MIYEWKGFEPAVKRPAGGNDRGGHGACKRLHRRQTTHRLLRVAAIAAVLALLLTVLNFWSLERDPQGNGIIAVPGVMRVYACEREGAEESSLEAFELTDTIDSYNCTWVPFVSLDRVGYGIPLTLQMDTGFFEGTEISFHLSVDFGIFFNAENTDDANKEIIAKNGETIVWYGRQWYDASNLIDPSGKYYGYILIYADETLVGYGIIDSLYQYKEGYLPSFSAINFSTYCFSLIDGEYQDVNEAYVWELIENHKENRE